MSAMLHDFGRGGVCSSGSGSSLVWAFVRAFVLAGAANSEQSVAGNLVLKMFRRRSFHVDNFLLLLLDRDAIRLG